MCEGMLENHLLTEEVKVMKVCLGLWGYVGDHLLTEEVKVIKVSLGV